ncbi:hypothetical protein QJQ45_013712, partial [Haematococcus lacustris]
AMLAPEVLSSLSWAEVALGISLRYLVPLLLHFTLVAGFFLAIILNPYSRLRMLASKDPGVPQDVSRMWRWQLQRMGPAKAPPNHHIDKIIDLCLLLQPVGLVQRLRSIMVMSRSNMRSFMQGPGSTPAPQALLSSLPQHGTLRLESLNLQMPSWSGASFMRNSTDPLHDQLASLRAGSSRLEHLPSVLASLARQPLTISRRSHLAAAAGIQQSSMSGAQSLTPPSGRWQLSEDSCDPIPAGSLTPGNASLSSNMARPTKSAGGALPPVDTVGWLGSRTALTPSASIFIKRHASLTDLGPRLKSATERPLTSPYNTEGIMVARTASVTTVPSLFQRRTAFAHSTKVHPVLGPRYGAGDDSLPASSGSMAAWPAMPRFSANFKPALLKQPSLSVAAHEQEASPVAKDLPPPPPPPSMPPTSGTFALKDHKPSSKQLAQGPVLLRQSSAALAPVPRFPMWHSTSRTLRRTVSTTAFNPTHTQQQPPPQQQQQAMADEDETELMCSQPHPKVGSMAGVKTLGAAAAGSGSGRVEAWLPLAPVQGEDQAHYDEAGKEHTPLLPHFDLECGAREEPGVVEADEQAEFKAGGSAGAREEQPCRGTELPMGGLASKSSGSSSQHTMQTGDAAASTAVPTLAVSSGNTPSNDVKLPAFAVKKRVARRNISFLMDVQAEVPRPLPKHNSLPLQGLSPASLPSTPRMGLSSSRSLSPALEAPEVAVSTPGKSVDTFATAAYRSPEPSPAEGVGSAASIVSRIAATYEQGSSSANTARGVECDAVLPSRTASLTARKSILKRTSCSNVGFNATASSPRASPELDPATSIPLDVANEVAVLAANKMPGLSGGTSALSATPRSPGPTAAGSPAQQLLPRTLALSEQLAAAVAVIAEASRETDAMCRVMEAAILQRMQAPSPPHVPLLDPPNALPDSGEPSQLANFVTPHGRTASPDFGARGSGPWAVKTAEERVPSRPMSAPINEHHDSPSPRSLLGSSGGLVWGLSSVQEGQGESDQANSSNLATLPSQQPPPLPSTDSATSPPARHIAQQLSQNFKGLLSSAVMRRGLTQSRSLGRAQRDPSLLSTSATEPLVVSRLQQMAPHLSSLAGQPPPPPPPPPPKGLGTGSGLSLRSRISRQPSSRAAGGQGSSVAVHLPSLDGPGGAIATEVPSDPEEALAAMRNGLLPSWAEKLLDAAVTPPEPGAVPEAGRGAAAGTVAVGSLAARLVSKGQEQAAGGAVAGRVAAANSPIRVHRRQAQAVAREQQQAASAHSTKRQRPMQSVGFVAPPAAAP